jgi:hypothetical protein
MAPTTTVQITVPAVVETSPSTTVPELDAPEEQHMPETGLNILLPLLISFQLIILGIAITRKQQHTR